MFVSVQQAINQGKGTLRIRGWVYRERKSNKFVFLVIRDSTNIIQCIVDRENVAREVWERAEKITIESSCIVEGTIKEEKRAPTGFEIHVNNLEIVNLAEPFPITKAQSPEFLLDQRHLWIRSRKLTTVMKVRSTVFEAIRRFFSERGFYEGHAPVFTPNACEGGSTLFEVKYFNDKVYLTQSWQLYAEAMIFALEKIYTIAPCFRAERSKTSRHLAEFWMAEMEAAWMNLNETIETAEGLVEFIVQSAVEKNPEELKLLGQDIENLKRIRRPFPRKTYTDVLEILKKDGIDIPWGKDLRTVEEDKIMEHFDMPIIVTNYPKEIMAFYKPVDPDDIKTALCFDMLAPEGYGEIIGGSERDTNIESLKESLEKEGEKAEKYGWYFDLRKYGSVPHSGFGLGVERVLAWICHLDNIKDAIPFPRTMLRKTP